MGSEPLAATLRRVADVAVDSHPGALFAGLSLIVAGEPQTAVFTDETSPEIDAAQYRTGSGPCLAAFRHRAVFRIADTRVDERWPEFAAAAIDHGILSTISYPLVVGPDAVGALNIYGSEVGAFDDVDEGPGLGLGTVMATLLVNATTLWDARALADDLREAMVARATIEQAKGVLMSSSPCSADDAFALLVRASQRENRKLRDIAADIVERVQPAPVRTEPPVPTG